MVLKGKENHYNKHKLLIEECKKKNKRAQLKLYKLYYKPMYTVSVNILNDRFLAEDIMQEAFISAFSKLYTFKGEVSFGAWLKRIVVNKCIDHLKSKKIQFESINSMAIEPAAEESIEVEKHTTTDILTQIKRLPEGFRTIITLYLLEGYDHEEIGQILNISPSTSRSQYSRAKALLIKRLKDL